MNTEYISKKESLALYEDDTPDNIALRCVINSLPTATIGVFIPMVKNKAVGEMEVLGAFSTEKSALEKLVSVISVAQREEYYMCIEQYQLDGRYVDTIYPFKEEDYEG
jgi:hypothetical protein